MAGLGRAGSPLPAVIRMVKRGAGDCAPYLCGGAEGTPPPTDEDGNLCKAGRKGLRPLPMRFAGRPGLKCRRATFVFADFCCLFLLFICLILYHTPFLVSMGKFGRGLFNHGFTRIGTDSRVGVYISRRDAEGAERF